MREAFCHLKRCDITLQVFFMRKNCVVEDIASYPNIDIFILKNHTPAQ